MPSPINKKINNYRHYQRFRTGSVRISAAIAPRRGVRETSELPCSIRAFDNTGHAAQTDNRMGQQWMTHDCLELIV